MPRPPAWNLGQRIVVVVAAGVLLHVVAQWLLYRDPSGGWFGYAPAAIPFSQVRRFSSAITALLTASFVVLWATFAAWLLQSRQPGGTEQEGAEQE